MQIFKKILIQIFENYSMYLLESVILLSVECTNDTYGLFCSEPCQCNDNQTCDSVNGSCTCKSGWEGQNCTQGEVS